MIIFANAKINLGLQITGKRSDGYHLLESLFIPIPLNDIIEITINEELSQDEIQILGNVETGPTEDNLVLRAINKLRESHDIPPLQISLLKQIPSGAGMGGGSSDATHTLKAVRELCHLNISDSELEAIALSLGADCPFFVSNTPRLVRGIGELFYPAPAIDFSNYHIVVIKPNVHIATKEAFAGLKQIGGQFLSVEEIIKQPISEWRTSLHNEFEDNLFPLYPELAHLKQLLYEQGAIYASMTGSGAALYGLFDRELSLNKKNKYSDIFFWQSKLDISNQIN